MPPSTRNLGISFGELDHFHDGLGEYARQFGKHLAALAPSLAQTHGLRTHFHMPERWHGMFGDAVAYLPVTRSQRRWHAPGMRFDVWHNLHQHIRQRPPLGTRHCITTLHDLNMVYAKQGFSRWRALRKQLGLLRRADEIICISDHVLADLGRHTSLTTPAMRIYNGVNSLTATPQEPVASLQGQAFLFHISRMTPNKNVDCLMDLAAHWPGQQFVFAGPKTGYTEGFRDQATVRGLRNVHFLFDVSEGQKAWLYNHCQGLLFPSITEGFGLPPVEAMYFGKAVFMSRCTSLPEIGGPLAQFFDAFDPASMLATITRGQALAMAPDFAQRTQRWASQFSWKACSEAYVERYTASLRR